MKIVNGFDLLTYAKERRLLPPAFNTTSLETTKAIIKGLNIVHLSGMVQISSNNLCLSDPEVIAYMMGEFLKGIDTSTGLHLDHEKSFNDVKACMDMGSTSIVVSAPHLSFEENIKEVKKTVEYCYFYHIPVEAELGAIMGREGDNVNEVGCRTSPTLVKEFIERSGCDILAIFIGNVRGLSTVTKIDLALLKRIVGVLPIPLVLHGGPGILSDQVKQIRDYNMIKVSCDSDLRRAFIQTFGGAHEENHNEVNLYGLSAKVMENVNETAADFILITNELRESQGGIGSMYYTGLDVGTSALKTTLMDARRSIACENSYSYTVLQPQEGWRETDPDVWIQAVVKGLYDIFARRNPQEASIIGIMEQIHTTVFLDKNGEAVHNIIMWTDLRTADMAGELHMECSQREETCHIAEILSSRSPTMDTLWIREHEPQSSARIHKIITSYVCIVYKLTGQYSMNYCEASTSSLYDITTRKWSAYMLDRPGVEENCLGSLYVNCDIVGALQRTLCKQPKVDHDIRVIARTGDNPINAVTVGILNQKEPVISLGTSGVVVMPKRDVDLEGEGKDALFNAGHTQFVNTIQGTVRSAGGIHK